MATVPFADRITCTINEALAISGLGRTKLYEAIDDGSLETTKIGTRRLVIMRSLKCLLDPAGQKRSA